MLILLALEKLLIFLLLLKPLRRLLLKLHLTIHLVTQPFVLLLQVEFFVFQDFVPPLLILLVLLRHIIRTRLQLNEGRRVLVVLVAELEVARKLQCTLGFDGLGADRRRHITAMLRHLVYEVLDVRTVILLQYLFFVRHRQVHDALHL